VRALEAAGPNRFLLEADLVDLVRQRNLLGDGTVSIPATYLEASRRGARRTIGARPDTHPTTDLAPVRLTRRPSSPG
jgi:hypothetical protein